MSDLNILIQIAEFYAVEIKEILDGERNSGTVDKELKKTLCKVANYIKKLGRERRIPFEVSADSFYSEENMSRLRKSIEKMESTGGTVHEVELDD